jgi:hypothetical protein
MWTKRGPGQVSSAVPCRPPSCRPGEPGAPAGQQGPQDEPQGDGQHPQARLQRRQPNTSCRYCAMNTKAPNSTKKSRTLVARARVEGPTTEQAQVQQRVGQRLLAAHDQHPDGQPGHNRQRRRRTCAARASFNRQLPNGLASATSATAGSRSVVQRARAVAGWCLRRRDERARAPGHSAG